MAFAHHAAEDRRPRDRPRFLTKIEAVICPSLLSEATNEGAHWSGPFPYNDGPVGVEARQHTHPHPRFAPDNSRVVFTSDKTGHAQLYEVLLEDAA